MNAFERSAVQRIVDKATAAGVEVPAAVSTWLDTCGSGSYAARAWAAAHPGEDGLGCCWGDVSRGPEACICWVPVYALEQAPPRPPTSPQDLIAQPAMCGDCAFRKGSPERADAWTEVALLELAEEGKPFWCHAGMRRPAHWEHPDGRVVDGSPDDWKPPMVNGIPYRADGSPGLLCAGWMARAARARGEIRSA